MAKTNRNKRGKGKSRRSVAQLLSESFLRLKPQRRGNGDLKLQKGDSQWDIWLVGSRDQNR